MYLKRLLAFLCCFTLVFCLFPSSAFASGGNGNIDGGGGSMGQGTSSNFWNSGNDGVRITVVDASPLFFLYFSPFKKPLPDKRRIFIFIRGYENM